MHRVNLDETSAAVQAFVLSLPVSQEGVELALHGQVLFKVVPSVQLTEAERQVIIERGRELVRRARERNRGVPARVIEREVREAVKQVRKRQSR